MNPVPTNDTTSTEVPLSELVTALSNAVGEEKAQAAVTEAATGLGETGPVVSREAALSILEAIAETPGLVGVTARFARTRLLLRSPPTTLGGR